MALTSLSTGEVFYQSRVLGMALTSLSTGDRFTSLSAGVGFNQSEYWGWLQPVRVLGMCLPV